jgi:hypothetical protein
MPILRLDVAVAAFCFARRVRQGYLDARNRPAASGRLLAEYGSMRRGVWRAVAGLAFGGALLPALPALAGFGAIAWDKESGKSGWVWNQPTAQKAAEGAVSQCGASGCKVIIRTRAGQCAALAATDGGKFIGAAARKSQDAARLAALTNCKKGNAGDCVVRVSECNK